MEFWQKDIRLQAQHFMVIIPWVRLTTEKHSLFCKTFNVYIRYF